MTRRTAVDAQHLVERVRQRGERAASDNLGTSRGDGLLHGASADAAYQAAERERAARYLAREVGEDAPLIADVLGLDPPERPTGPRAQLGGDVLADVLRGVWAGERAGRDVAAGLDRAEAVLAREALAGRIGQR